MIKFKYEKTHSQVPDLERAYEYDACYDLYAQRDVTINAHAQRPIPVGIKLQLPEDAYARIWERSGMSLKTTLNVKAGVIDAGYRGEIMVVMGNYGYTPQKILRGDKIAQLSILPLPETKAELVDKVDELTERGDKGFGSSDEN